MAFDPKGYYGAPGSTGVGGVLYYDTEDTLAQVREPGYFENAMHMASFVRSQRISDTMGVRISINASDGMEWGVLKLSNKLSNTGHWQLTYHPASTSMYKMNTNRDTNALHDE